MNWGLAAAGAPCTSCVTSMIYCTQSCTCNHHDACTNTIDIFEDWAHESYIHFTTVPGQVQWSNSHRPSCAGPSLAGPPAVKVTVPITGITDISRDNSLQKIGICVLAIGLDSLLASISDRQYSYHRVRTTDIVVLSH
jgi:hypothetical protein